MMKFKIWSTIVVMGLACAGTSHALTVDGVEVTASISVQDGSPAKEWRTTNYNLPSTLTDWVLFNGASITTPAEEKSGGTALNSFVAGINGTVSDAGGNSLEFTWTDGTATSSATQDMGAIESFL